MTGAATKPQWRSLYACQAGSRARSLLRSAVTFISVLVAAITMTSSRQVRTRLYWRGDPCHSPGWSPQPPDGSLAVRTNSAAQSRGFSRNPGGPFAHLMRMEAAHEMVADSSPASLTDE